MSDSPDPNTPGPASPGAGGSDQITGRIVEPEQGQPERFRTVRVDPELADRLAKDGLEFTGAVENTWLSRALAWVLPIAFILALWMFLQRRLGQAGGLGGGLMSVGKSKAKIYAEEDVKVSFEDVAGVDEAKEELKEIIGFLREPERYGRLGARLPKGILLVGPPGTGKTLLARAVAGEAGVPFFSISGSEFVEMFVGVGAARVRDLFEQARGRAPCIIFIDELDAMGRARGMGPMAGGHDEKEQTLNQLLSELDGFDPSQGVVLLAATNRPEILDAALLRAGRFDRQILVDRPDKQARVEILQLHLRKLSLAPDAKAEPIAALTPGFTGADLANLVNEAAILATRNNATHVSMDDFNLAIERIVAGLEKKNRLLNEHERKVTAYHEMGHALVARALPGSDPVHKVSIIPRGIGALGYTIQRPTEDRFLMSSGELKDKMTVLLGGRAAESIVFGETSTGAADDLAKATNIARSMVTRYGMDDNLGMVSLESERSTFLQMPGEYARHAARLLRADRSGGGLRRARPRHPGLRARRRHPGSPPRRARRERGASAREGDAQRRRAADASRHLGGADLRCRRRGSRRPCLPRGTGRTPLIAVAFCISRPALRSWPGRGPILAGESHPTEPA